MNDYVSGLRKLIGTRPLILCGAAVVLLDKEHRVLLHHRTDNDYWGLPAGATELGERVEETAVRETQEEVGITCHTLELFGVYSGPELYYRYPHGDEVHNVTIVYLCRDFSGEIRVDPVEGKEARFFPIDALPSPITPTLRVVSEDLQRRFGQILTVAEET